MTELAPALPTDSAQPPGFVVMTISRSRSMKYR